MTTKTEVAQRLKLAKEYLEKADEFLRRARAMEGVAADEILAARIANPKLTTRAIEKAVGRLPTDGARR